MNNAFEAYKKSMKNAFMGNGLPVPSSEGVLQTKPEAPSPAAKPLTYSPVPQVPAVQNDEEEIRRSEEQPLFTPAYSQHESVSAVEEKPLNPYFVNSVMTASPAKLTLMLYDGALRFINESIKHIEDKSFDKAHAANIRAQDIYVELMSTLNRDYEIAEPMFNLYAFILDSLVKANVKKDAALLRDMIGLTQEFRDTWAEAMKIAASENVAEKTEAK